MLKFVVATFVAFAGLHASAVQPLAIFLDPASPDHLEVIWPGTSDWKLDEGDEIIGGKFDGLRKVIYARNTAKSAIYEIEKGLASPKLVWSGDAYLDLFKSATAFYKDNNHQKFIIDDNDELYVLQENAPKLLGPLPKLVEGANNLSTIKAKGRYIVKVDVTYNPKLEINWEDQVLPISSEINSIKKMTWSSVGARKVTPYSVRIYDLNPSLPGSPNGESNSLSTFTSHVHVLSHVTNTAILSRPSEFSQAHDHVGMVSKIIKYHASETLHKLKLLGDRCSRTMAD